MTLSTAAALSAVSQLQQTLRDVFVEKGGAWKHLRGTASSPFRWRRPPLVTSTELRGVRLQDATIAPCELSTDELVEIYEAFIETFYIQRQWPSGPYPWLRHRITLPARYFNTLFCNSTRREWSQSDAPFLNTILGMTALVHYNHPGQVTLTSDTYTVTVDPGYTFGVINGRAVSNMHRKFMQHATPYFYGLPTLACRQRGKYKVSRGAGTLLDDMLAWLGKYRDRFRSQSERHACEEALRLLFWVAPNKGSWHNPLQTLGFQSKSPEAMLMAVREARDFRNFDRPYRTLREIFIPQYMPATEFNQRFGRSHTPRNPNLRPDGPRAEELGRWDAALDLLEAEAQEKLEALSAD